MLSRDTYSIIADYLGPIDTLKSLQLLCHESHNIIPDIDIIKHITENTYTNISRYRQYSELAMNDICKYYIDYYDISKYIRLSAETHNITMLKYLTRDYDLTIEDKKYIYRTAIEYNNIAMLEWLKYTEKIYGFIIARITSRGNLEVLKWLYARNLIHDFFQSPHLKLLSMCKHGHTDCAKWYLSITVADWPVNRLFIEACYNGKLNTAQWLYSTFDIDIHHNNDEAYITCQDYHVKQWLKSLGFSGSDVGFISLIGYRFNALKEYIKP